jgi:hypothetical protein
MKRRRLFVAIDFSKYRGRYISLVRREIVACGRHAEEVWLEAKKKYSHAQPEILKVSKGETLMLTVCG